MWKLPKAYGLCRGLRDLRFLSTLHFGWDQAVTKNMGIFGDFYACFYLKAPGICNFEQGFGCFLILVLRLIIANCSSILISLISDYPGFDPHSSMSSNKRSGFIGFER